MKIAVLSYWWEPLPTAPVSRVKAMLQALTLEGHEVTLVTRHFNSASTDWHSLITPTRGKEVEITKEEGVRVIRLPLRERRLLARARTGLEMNKLKRVQWANRIHYFWNGWPLYHDMRAWSGLFLNTLIKELQGTNVLIVSCPPFSGLAVGLQLQEALGCGLIADYRDMWTAEGQALTKTQKEQGYWARLRKRQERGREAALLGAYNVVVTVNELLANKLQSSFSLKHSVEVIPNGINPAWRKASNLDAFLQDSIPTFVYAGALYEAQDPDNVLFKGIEEFTRTYPEKPIRLFFIGSDVNEVERRKAEIKNANIFPIECIERLPQLEYYDALSKAHAVIALDYGVGNEGVASAKAYDYIGCGRPILYIGATTKANALASILAEGPVTKASTAEEITAAILTLSSEWIPTQNPDREAIAGLYADKQAQKWVSLVNGKPRH